MARAFIATVPLTLILVAAVIVPFTIIPGTFGFNSWPEAPQSVAQGEQVVLDAPIAERPAAPAVAPHRPARGQRPAQPDLVAAAPQAETPSGPAPAPLPVETGEPRATGDQAVLGVEATEDREAPRELAPVTPPAHEAVQPPIAEIPAKEAAEDLAPDALPAAPSIGGDRRERSRGGHGRRHGTD